MPVGMRLVRDSKSVSVCAWRECGEQDEYEVKGGEPRRRCRYQCNWAAREERQNPRPLKVEK